MTKRPFRIVVTAGLLLAVVAAALPAAAQDSVPQRKKYGFYVGVYTTRFALSKTDFDGISLLVPEESEAFIIPSFGSAQALGFCVGAGTGRGGRDRFSVEVRFSQAKPAATFWEVQPEARAANWSLSLRYAYTEGFVQPYIRGGLVYSRLRVADGALPAEGEAGDAVFIGGGLELGLGLSLWIAPCFSFFAEGSVDSMDYRNVKGAIGETWSIVSIDGSGLAAGRIHYAVGLQIVY